MLLNRLLSTKVIIDIVCFIIVIIPPFVAQLITPFQRGIFCEDTSIKYPIKPSTVPAWVLFMSGIAIGFIVILIAEYARFLRKKRQRVAGDYQLKRNFLCFDSPSWIYHVFRCFSCFIFGAFLNISITDIIKVSVGRLRPYFWTLCKPKFSQGMCPSDESVENFSCENVHPDDIREARLSFVSGHSSFSAYVFLFTTIYLEQRAAHSSVLVPKRALQLTIFFLGLLTCLSRISDHKHHPSDVIAGAGLGLIVAYFTIDLMRKRNEKRKQQEFQGKIGIGEGIYR